MKGKITLIIDLSLLRLYGLCPSIRRVNNELVLKLFPSDFQGTKLHFLRVLTRGNL